MIWPRGRRPARPRWNVLIGLRDVPHAHQPQTPERIMHGASGLSLFAFLREDLKTQAVGVGDHMAVVNRFIPAGEIADYLDEGRFVGIGIGAFHDDVAQAEHVHAHRPDFRLATDDGDEGETHGVGAAVFGHFEPGLSAVGQRAVVNEDARAAGPHESRAGLHHRPGCFHRTAGTAQESIDGVAVNGRQLSIRRRPPAGGAKDPGELVVRLHRVEFDLLAVRQNKRRARETAVGWQPLDKFSRMGPPARNAHVDLNRGGCFIHFQQLFQSTIRMARNGGPELA